MQWPVISVVLLILGLFNICDKLLVAIEILVHWRELFKRGVPLTVAIESSLESWKKCGLVLLILLQHIRLNHCNIIWIFLNVDCYVLDINLAFLQIISKLFVPYPFIFIYRFYSSSLKILCDVCLKFVIFFWNQNTFAYFCEWKVEICHIFLPAKLNCIYLIFSSFNFYFVLFFFRWNLMIMSRSTSQDCCTMVFMHWNWFRNEIWMMWFVEFVVLLVRFILVMVMKRTAVA